MTSNRNLHKNIEAINDLKKAVSDWETSVKWITKGWDCIDEYENDLSYRETLANLLNKFSINNKIPKEIEEQLIEIDNKFKIVTEKSDLCIWDHDPNLEVCIYDKEEYWYYYHWQPDSPVDYKNMVCFKHQKKFIG